MTLRDRVHLDLVDDLLGTGPDVLRVGPQPLTIGAIEPCLERAAAVDLNADAHDLRLVLEVDGRTDQLVELDALELLRWGAGHGEPDRAGWVSSVEDRPLAVGVDIAEVGARGVHARPCQILATGSPHAEVVDQRAMGVLDVDAALDTTATSEEEQDCNHWTTDKAPTPVPWIEDK